MPEHTQDWDTDSWRAQTKPCAHQDPGERSSDRQETDPDLPVSAQGSPAEAWAGGGLLQGQRQLSMTVHKQDLLKEVASVFIQFSSVQLFSLVRLFVTP